jgi:hypothetical protein
MTPPRRPCGGREGLPMTRRFSWIVIVLVLIVGAVPLRASSPPIAGRISGVELCPQSVCGAAIFVAAFAGRVGLNPAFGTVSVAMNHDPLPDPYQQANVTGGVWTIRLLSGRTFSGTATGTLFNNGDNTFTVSLGLQMTGGGSGPLTFNGLLSHRVFPPTIVGQISQ